MYGNITETYRISESESGDVEPEDDDLFPIERVISMVRRAVVIKNHEMHIYKAKRLGLETILPSTTSA